MRRSISARSTSSLPAPPRPSEQCDLVGNFAVLNRINVADPPRIVGHQRHINSLVNGQTGGSIFFYSPSGFVIGSSAVINVGSLVLTASPITVDGNGNFINGTTRHLRPGAQSQCAAINHRRRIADQRQWRGQLCRAGRAVIPTRARSAPTPPRRWSRPRRRRSPSRPTGCSTSRSRSAPTIPTASCRRRHDRPQQRDRGRRQPPRLSGRGRQE
jgi:filamentous hemagglutinin family protein